MSGAAATRARRRAPVKMPPALRWTVFGVFGALWLTGCLWLVLHWGFEQQSEFGPLPNPWEATVLKVHGWLAVAGVFLLGWIAGSHALERWMAPRNRNSGLWLASGAGLILISGYALYYTTDRLQAAASALHEVLGVLAIALALAHWRGAGRISRNRKAPRGARRPRVHSGFSPPAP